MGAPLFEVTVLWASIGMTVSYYYLNNMYPGKMPKIIDPRTTDHKFALTFELNDSTEASYISEMTELLKRQGASEVFEKKCKQIIRSAMNQLKIAYLLPVIILLTASCISDPSKPGREYVPEMIHSVSYQTNSEPCIRIRYDLPTAGSRVDSPWRVQLPVSEYRGRL